MLATSFAEAAGVAGRQKWGLVLSSSARVSQVTYQTVVGVRYAELVTFNGRSWNFGFFSCIAGRVRDMVGQLLEIRLELKANWVQKFPWKRTKNNKKNKPQNTPQQAPNNNTTAREIRKTK